MTKRQRDIRNIIIAIAIILLLWVIVKKQDDSPMPLGDEDDCQDYIEPIECFSNCPHPQSGIFFTSACGVQEDCDDSSGFPNYNAPNCDPLDPTPIDDGQLDDPIWGFDILGCTDAIATNYDPSATTDDGSCNYNLSTNDVSTFGCCIPFSNNFDPSCPSDPMCTCANYLC